MIPERLRTMYERMDTLSRQPWSSYDVPGRWVGGSPAESVRFASAPAYFKHQLERLATLCTAHPGIRPAQEHVVAYSCLVRHVTAWNHGEATSADGWRCEGTIAKLIALLPYLVNLGVGTVALLPIMDRGVLGKKGTHGSPYAVRHPMRLDPTLAEPALGLGVDAEFRTFVDTCHALGIRVLVEVVLRTASIDSDLVAHHPEWFYWVDEDAIATLPRGLEAPVFSADAIATAKHAVERGVYVNLPEPEESYKALFQPPPKSVQRDDQGWLGIGVDRRHRRIPGAFADWPPDDPQPAWSDVTYYRLHDHPRYRYVAYNTIRMFERELDSPEYRQPVLWNVIAQVIPHFVRMYGIDGAMIDMGHALPPDLRRRVISEARHAKSDIILWEENFALEAASARAGYDAVLGYLPFDAVDFVRLASFVHRLAEGDRPVPFLATAESHNTPRSSMERGPAFARAVWAILRLLPGGRPFVLSGVELGEVIPMNTGLGFGAGEQERWTPDDLPLFSHVPLPWLATDGWDATAATVNASIRSTLAGAHLTDHDELIPIVADMCLGYIRKAGELRVGFLVLMSWSHEATTHEVDLPSAVALVAPHDDLVVRRRTLQWKAKPYAFVITTVAFTTASPTKALE